MGRKDWPLYLFCVLILAAPFFHEIWLDEAQGLLIASTANGPWDLLTRTLRYEGHPALWHFLIRLSTFGSVSVLPLQVFNSILMIGGAFLFWWRYPLPLNLKALLLFNFYFLYEYGVIARPYSLSVFLLFFFLAFQNDPRPWWRRMSFGALLLLSQTTVYGLIVMGGILFYRLLKTWKIDRFRGLQEGTLGLVFVGLFVWQALPPPDASYASGSCFSLL